MYRCTTCTNWLCIGIMYKDDTAQRLVQLKNFSYFFISLALWVFILVNYVLKDVNKYMSYSTYVLMHSPGLYVVIVRKSLQLSVTKTICDIRYSWHPHCRWHTTPTEATELRNEPVKSANHDGSRNEPALKAWLREHGRGTSLEIFWPSSSIASPSWSHEAQGLCI